MQVRSGGYPAVADPPELLTAGDPVPDPDGHRSGVHVGVQHVNLVGDLHNDVVADRLLDGGEIRRVRDFGAVRKPVLSGDHGPCRRGQDGLPIRHVAAELGRIAHPAPVLVIELEQVDGVPLRHLQVR